MQLANQITTFLCLLIFQCTHQDKCLQKILNRFYGPVGIYYRLEAPFWYLAYNEITILLATKSLQDGHIAIDAECI